MDDPNNKAFQIHDLIQGRIQTLSKRGMTTKIHQKKGGDRILFVIFLSILHMKMTNFPMKRGSQQTAPNWNRRCNPKGIIHRMVPFGRIL